MSLPYSTPTCRDVMEQYLEEKAGDWTEDERRRHASILGFLRICLHTHGKLNPAELMYLRSLRLPGQPYHLGVADLFGPDKIEEVLYYFIRRYWKSGRVHCSEDTIERVPDIVRELCDWLYQRGHVTAPIVEPFRRYKRALKRDAADRRRGKVPFADRPPKSPWPELDYSTTIDPTAGSMDPLRALEHTIDVDTPGDPWSDGPLH